ncbi:MAG TPA: cyclopropane-fatty-acyl-phospholipid synthase family protein, partial [Acetobacteraceae bacterium]|nr:cyclopropane-fatty-acyl-phospholipid synthase family protein [Acetobacteraceae bacterium]
MRGLLDKLLRRLIREGELNVIWPDGTRSRYGRSGGLSATMAITDEAAIRALLLNPGLALGEAYMEGTVQAVDCSIYDLLYVLLGNSDLIEKDVPVLRLRSAINRVIRPVVQANDSRRARRNVAHHYDLNGRLYSLFLDRDRQYSCAYFPRGDETIDEAQLAKKHHIASKLLLDRPDLTVLDIGCGWGGMALTLARDYGAKVTGITLSEEQLAEARRRAAAEGLADRVSFELMDYRAMTRSFDRIVSVGMFEHVGVGYYPAFFDAVSRCLNPDGVALLHAIGRSDQPGSTNP